MSKDTVIGGTGSLPVGYRRNNVPTPVDKQAGDALKAIMGYKEEETRWCEKCLFHKQREDPMEDRFWYDVCTFPNVGEFVVRRHGSCEKWKPIKT